MKQNSIIITVVAVFIAVVIAFYGGMQYQKSQRNSNFAQFAQGANGQRRFSNQAGQNGTNRPVVGEILSADDKSITVKLQDGSSKIVLLSDTTPIMEATAAGKQALTTGKQVLVLGTQNSDGSITAQNIQLNPQTRGGNMPR